MVYMQKLWCKLVYHNKYYLKHSNWKLLKHKEKFASKKNVEKSLSKSEEFPKKDHSWLEN